MKTSILGAGNWGTTMALHLHRLEHSVTLWEYDSEQAERVAKTRRNEKFLPGFNLPPPIVITNELSRAVESADVIFLAVPAQSCRQILKAVGRLSAGAFLVSLIKGIEQESLCRVSEMAGEELEAFSQDQYAVLSGPTIAVEVAAGLPTSAVLASSGESKAAELQAAFSSDSLRLYTSPDVAGVEFAGALKNVMALAAGICDGMKLGFNTKGSLLTRGLAEMARFGKAVGGDPRTFSGLSGMGDLVTTCSSPHSRNRTVGERIGGGEKLQSILKNMVMVAEGVWTARAAKAMAERYDVEMPITDAVCAVLFDDMNPKAAVEELMTRTLKAED